MIIGLLCPQNFFAPWDFVKSALALEGKYKFLAIQGHSVPHNRNYIWTKAKSLKEDLLFADTDMVFSPEDAWKIEKHLETYDIITGLYVLANEVPAIFKRDKEDYQFTQPQQGIFEVAACGAGFLGISKRIHDKLPKDPFSNIWEGAIQHGEDVSFCHRAREQGIKIYCDGNIRLGHVRTITLKP